jgi:hypothetical protein
MKNPLDEEDEVENALAELTPELMDPAQVADALERLAREARPRLTPGQAELLWVAARRLRQAASMCETLLYQREEIDRLGLELARLRGGVKKGA